MERRLEALYDRCKQLVLDSKAVVEEVDKYRNDWKPPKTTFVLLAESHAHTTERQFAQLLKRQFNHKDGTRSRYVNFVYCIGNSESFALEHRMETRSPTTQYWRILYSCLNPIRRNEDFYKFEEGSSEERASKKAVLLNDLKKAGIWLLDASVVAVNILDRKSGIKIMRLCWDKHLVSLLEQLKRNGLRCVVVIGKTVNEVLSSKLSELGVKVVVVPQPQARIKGGYLPSLRLISRTCKKYRL